MTAEQCQICGRTAEQIAQEGCDVAAHLVEARQMSPNYCFDLEHPIDPNPEIANFSICPRTPSGQIYPLTHCSGF